MYRHIINNNDNSSNSKRITNNNNNNKKNNNNNNNIQHHPHQQSAQYLQQFQFQSNSKLEQSQNVIKTLNQKRKSPDSTIEVNNGFYGRIDLKNNNNNNNNNNSNEDNNSVYNNDIDELQSEDTMIYEQVKSPSPTKRMKKELNDEQREIGNSNNDNNNCNNKRYETYKDILKYAEFLSNVEELNSDLKQIKNTLNKITLDMASLETRLKSIVGINTILIVQSNSEDNNTQL